MPVLTFSCNYFFKYKYVIYSAIIVFNRSCFINQHGGVGVEIRGMGGTLLFIMAKNGWISFFDHGNGWGIRYFFKWS